ncbi:hypothetical protein J6590_087923, partial [Homalodisca vitripennis]
DPLAILTYSPSMLEIHHRALSDRGLRVTIGGESFAVCDSVKTLGLVLDRDLTFSNDVTYTIQRDIDSNRKSNRISFVYDVRPEPRWTVTDDCGGRTFVCMVRPNVKETLCQNGHCR